MFSSFADTSGVSTYVTTLTSLIKEQPLTLSLLSHHKLLPPLQALTLPLPQVALRYMYLCQFHLPTVMPMSLVLPCLFKALLLSLSLPMMPMPQLLDLLARHSWQLLPLPPQVGCYHSLPPQPLLLCNRICHPDQHSRRHPPWHLQMSVSENKL